MPQIENRAALTLLIALLVAVPGQYLISHVSISRDSSGRHVAFQRLLSSAIGFRNKYLSLRAWSEWCQGILGVFGGQGADDPNGESPAFEVLLYDEYQDTEEDFPYSTKPQPYRPAEVKYRIGQVIRSKFFGFRGVIIGWRYKPTAQKELMKKELPEEMALLQDPVYAVLVDVRDRMTPQMTYTYEQEIELDDKTRVMHPKLDFYFESYYRGRYIPRPWLQWVYPED